MLSISKYFPPAKIISLRNDIMNFIQLDHEHVAQSWGRMKLMIDNPQVQGIATAFEGRVFNPNLLMIIQKIYAGLNFASRNLLDSAAGGTFLEIALGEATKLLDNIMVHAIEEINVLSGKMDELMNFFANKSVSSDPNDMPKIDLLCQNKPYEKLDLSFFQEVSNWF